MIDVALGGRAAEEMIYGYDDVTSGCSSDLVRATDVATRMIRSFGFSDKVGLVAHGDEESVYLSSKKKDEIEGEIRQFLDNGMERVKGLLKKNEHELHTVSRTVFRSGRDVGSRVMDTRCGLLHSDAVMQKLTCSWQRRWSSTKLSRWKKCARC